MTVWPLERFYLRRITRFANVNLRVSTLMRMMLDQAVCSRCTHLHAPAAGFRAAYLFALQSRRWSPSERAYTCACISGCRCMQTPRKSAYREGVEEVGKKGGGGGTYWGAFAAVTDDHHLDVRVEAPFKRLLEALLGSHLHQGQRRIRGPCHHSMQTPCIDKCKLNLRDYSQNNIGIAEHCPQM